MDITKCSGSNCPLKDTCFRYTAKASDFRQSYFTELPYDFEKQECSVYWGIKSEAVIKQLEEIFGEG